MKYFEDLTVGETYRSGGRTVTKTQIVEFGTTFDPQPFHVDEVAAEESMFGGIIASGIHTFAICQRLATEAFYEDTAMVVGQGVDELRFPTPTYPDDTLSVTLTVADKRDRTDRSDSGHVEVEIRGFNQDDQEVVSWTALLIVAHRPPE